MDAGGLWGCNPTECARANNFWVSREFQLNTSWRGTCSDGTPGTWHRHRLVRRSFGILFGCVPRGFMGQELCEAVGRTPNQDVVRISKTWCTPDPLPVYPLPGPPDSSEGREIGGFLIGHGGAHVLGPILGPIWIVLCEPTATAGPCSDMIGPDTGPGLCTAFCDAAWNACTDSPKECYDAYQHCMRLCMGDIRLPGGQEFPTWRQLWPRYERLELGERW